jgi:hypothetical protein
MTHLDRDDLILLHYGETASPGAREHLLGCEECRRESALLRRVLDAVDEHTVETPELAPAWEEKLWNRLRWKLERRRTAWIGWAAAAAAMIVIGFLAGRTFLPRSTPIAQQMATSTAEGRERVLLVVLGNHLSRSERVLTEVKNASADAPPFVIADRDTLEDLVRKNRLYLDAAQASGQTSLANVLEQMQPLLLELARAPENPTADDIRMLQKRIEKRGALLELRVAGEQIRQRQQRKL